MLQHSVGPELFYVFLQLLEKTGFFNASLYTPFGIAGVETLGIGNWQSRQSYREGKTVKKRRIASLGNIDAYSDKEIEQIILKLESLLQNRVVGSIDDLNPIAEHGYSRTHRSDLEQVELGLLVTPDGLPITHEVFSGETPDKNTVPDILKRCKNEFGVQQCVFAGNRGAGLISM
ncbi:hypothetical protein [Paradesulfitobacterium ferrireducens]|uniref:hypothetical protein n=1 Tax=Paradesulfitobacterium ferrireducens TaxID=2816476 RepID=UPI0038B30E9B